VTRISLQILLEQDTEARASAIVRYVGKVSNKEVGQDVFMLQSLGGETAARVTASSRFWAGSAGLVCCADAPTTRNRANNVRNSMYLPPTKQDCTKDSGAILG
jgi:hypothetical protein